MRDAELSVTPEAYCTARMHLPLELLQDLLQRLDRKTSENRIGKHRKTGRDSN